MIKNKKGYYLSLDALIALIIILGVVLVIQPNVNHIPPQVNLQGDLIISLSSIEIGDLNNTYAKSLILSGDITNLEQSVLEQIGEFYALSDSKANLLAQSILDDIDTDKNIGLYFGGIEMATSNTIPLGNARDIWTARQIISGIQNGSTVKGFSSRAFLKASNKVEYFYFGGYVGDGNISIELPDQIENVEIEGVFGDDFDVYINNNLVQTHYPTPDIPYSFDLLSHISQFDLPTNTLKFEGKNKNLFVAGGFIKASINETQFLGSATEKKFPGIEGLVNLYDSFYIPGNLNSLEIVLHYNSTQNLFLAIGNKTVFRGNSSGLEETIIISDSTLSTLLDYNTLDKETIPIRLGIDNVTFLFNATNASDTFSVTDLSGSMEECALNCSTGDPIKIIDLAIEANKAFTDIFLAIEENREGLVGYETSAKDEDYHALTKDSDSLKAEVDTWKPGGGTCICCGINRATQGLIAESSSSSFQSMVVMSDGKANVKCSEQGTGNAALDAIQAACTAYNDYGIHVYSVGFGKGVDEETLQSIASCGGGSYYYSDIEDLVATYQEIAVEVISAVFVEQTVIGRNIHTILYPDSHISMDFDQESKFGLVINGETEEFGNLISEGTVIIPNDTEPLSVGVVSYSGSKWTDNVEIFDSILGTWDKIFSLPEYNVPYVDIGDPFMVNIPIEKINRGENRIRVSTGLTSLNSTGGNNYDKIIYSLLKNASSFSPIVASASGCIWTIEFEDTTNVTVTIPNNYTGTDVCSYSSNNIAYNSNDAIDLAIYRLLVKLDLDGDKRVDTKFSESELSLSSSEVTGIPFTWDTEVQVRVWR